MRLWARWQAIARAAHVPVRPRSAAAADKTGKAFASRYGTRASGTLLIELYIVYSTGAPSLDSSFISIFICITGRSVGIFSVTDFLSADSATDSTVTGSWPFFVGS